MTDHPKAEPYVLRDMMRKCGDEITQTVMVNALLLDHPMDRVTIAIGGTAKAFGIAVGFFVGANEDEISPEDVADALWERLRPLVIKGTSAVQARESAR